MARNVQMYQPGQPSKNPCLWPPGRQLGVHRAMLKPAVWWRQLNIKRNSEVASEGDGRKRQDLHEVDNKEQRTPKAPIAQA